MRHLLILLCTAFVISACQPVSREMVVKTPDTLQPSSPAPLPAPLPATALDPALNPAPVAEVNGVLIQGIDFQKRLRFERRSLQDELEQLQLLEQQFGGQGFFTTQIDQTEILLDTPVVLAVGTLDSMIEDILIAQAAAARAIIVSNEEVEQALRQEVTNGLGLVTEPQATATAVAAAATATVVATAAADPNAAVAEMTPWPIPPPAAVITERVLIEALGTVEQNLADATGLSLDEYREILRSRLLRSKLVADIGAETVAAGEEQVRARHILLIVDESPEAAGGGQGPYTDAEALALANQLRGRILGGEDFAVLAQAYSADVGASAKGGDIGWFGRDTMVVAFEQAAFALQVGEVSQPVRTDFGYHLIELLDRDENRPKDPAQLAQEQAQAFQSWLNQELGNSQVQRANNLLDYLPDDSAPIAVPPDDSAPTVVPAVVLPAVVQPGVPVEWINGPMLGNPDAALVVQVWSDYLCPTCQEFAMTSERELIKEYVESGQVQLVYHYFPLQQHEPRATMAALASACAAVQNRFWSFHWLVMEAARRQGQAAATLDALIQSATAAGLDGDAFAKCLIERQQWDVLNASVLAAQRLGLQFLPSVFVGDTLMQDFRFAGIRDEIESQLR